MAQTVKGKTAIVTGAGSGINLEFARLLLENGANVLFADLGLRPEAETLVAQYQSTPKAIFQRTDVTSWADLDKMFKVAVEHFNSVDIVCPGAGVFEPAFSSFWVPPGSPQSKDEAAGDRYKSIDINFTHPIRVTQMAISHFLNASSPSSTSNPKTVVHISSIAGEAASLPFPIYHATKHGIYGFVQSLADLQQHAGIRVAGVMPGVVKTPLWTDNPDKLKIVKQDGERADIWVTPEDVAKIMLALVKDDEVSSAIGGSGDMIPIKGGTMLEVLAGVIRDVPLFNNTGPYTSGAPGATVTDAAKIYDDVLQALKPGWG